MADRHQKRQYERWFDGEGPPVELVDADLRAHAESLQEMRNGAHALANRRAIEDAQFPAFYEGIRSRLDRPARRYTGLWALASLTAAALVVALSLFTIFAGDPADVSATEIINVSTEIEGAKIDTSETDNAASVWVTLPEGDIL